MYNQGAQWRKAGAWISLGMTALACSGPGTSDDGSGGAGTSSLEDEYTYTSLDLTALAAQSENWCQAPSFSPAGFGTLDKARFAQLIADYTVGWLTPLHESMLGLDEESVWKALFEVVPAAFDTGCNWNEPGDYDFAPPRNDELLDPEVRSDARSEILAFIDDATELESGSKLRLAVHDCSSCYEPLGSQPSFINAQVTSDGVLVVTVELSDGSSPVRTLYITPDAVVMQAALGPVAEWFADLNEETRSGEVIIPQVSGTITAVARKDNQGGVSTSMGIGALQLDAQPGQAKTVKVATSDCIGMHVALKASTGESQMGLHAGDLTVTVPGALNCDASECGQKERDEDWIYTLGGLSVGVEQPASPRQADTIMAFHTDSASRAQVGSDVFAEGGIGPQGRGGDFALEVDTNDEGYVVTFNPPLSLGGAMTISKFSDDLRLNLPGWLTDEIFDVTFGGSPRASVLVPFREQCPDDEFEDPFTRSARREVRILEGTLNGEVGSGAVSATVNQCVGASLTDDSTYTWTSDWVEVGFVCE